MPEPLQPPGQTGFCSVWGSVTHTSQNQTRSHWLKLPFYFTDDFKQNATCIVSVDCPKQIPVNSSHQMTAPIFGVFSLMVRSKGRSCLVLIWDYSNSIPQGHLSCVRERGRASLTRLPFAIHFQDKWLVSKGTCLAPSNSSVASCLCYQVLHCFFPVFLFCFVFVFFPHFISF